MNPQDLRRGMQVAVDEVLEKLKAMSKPISTQEEIRQVASISSNGDIEVGDMIAKAMEKVGNSGVITVQDGKTVKDELEVVEGMRFDRGYISPYFVTDVKTQKVELEDALILFYEKKVSNLQAILPTLETAMKDSKPLLIVAEDIEGEALAALVVNKLRGGLKVCAVKAPGFGDNRKANLQDLAILTGGAVISEDIGLKLENVTMEHLGQAKKITISKDDTIILDGSGSKESITERVELLQESIDATTSEYEKEKLQERLAKLSGGVAVIKAGGASEVEVGEKKDRITDALNSSRLAVEEGVVVGGGSALLHASKSLQALTKDSPNIDHKIGIEIIERAIQQPLKTIVDNAGLSGDVVAGKLLETDDQLIGYDAQMNQYANLIEKGIIDPTKVTSIALVDAFSVASLMSTTECIITEKIDENAGGSGGGGGMPPGMGGMGGMPGMM